MPAIDANTPIPGHYRRRLVRNGPWLPCKIWIVDGERDDAGELTSDQTLCATVNGKDADPFDIWTYVAGQPITEAQYRAMTGNAAWAAGTAEPEAMPERAVDLVNAAPVW